MLDENNDVANTKRIEYIADVMSGCKDVLYMMLMRIWIDVYTNKEIPQRLWLQEFQLALKQTVTFSHADFEASIHKHMRPKDTLKSLYNALVSTGHIFHNTTLFIRKDLSLLVHFIRDSLVYVARQLWYKPFYPYHISHKRHKHKEAKEAFDKLISESISFTIRQQANEICIAQENLKSKRKNMLDMDNSNDDKSDISSDDSITDTYTGSSSTEDSSLSTIDSEVDKKERCNKSILLDQQTRCPSFELDPITSTMTPVMSISRASSCTSKPLLNVCDDVEDLFVPRNTPTSTTIPDKSPQYRYYTPSQELQDRLAKKYLTR